MSYRYSEPLAETIKRRAVDVSATSNEQSRIVRVRQFAPYIGIGVVMFLIFFAYSGRRSLWGDEAYSVNMAYLPWHAWIHMIWGTEANMALYSAILRAWIWLTNTVGLHSTDMVVRLPSVVCSAVSVVGVLAIGRRFLGEWAGWIGTLLYAFSVNTMYFSQETRSYSFYVAATVVGYLFLLEALRHGASSNPDPRNTRLLWGGYVAAMTVAVYVQFISVTFVMAQVMTVAALVVIPNAWRQSAWKQSLWALGSATLVAVFSAPLLYDGLRHGASNLWVPIPTWTSLEQLYWQYASGYGQTATTVIYTLIVVGACTAFLVDVGARLHKTHPARESLSLERSKDESHMTALVVVLVGWTLLPTAIAYVLSLPPLDQHLFLVRYQLAVFPPLFLLAATFLVYTTGNHVRVAMSALLVVFILINWYEYQNVNVVRGSDLVFAYQGYEEGLNWAEDRAHPGDGVMCIGDYSCIMLTQYYLEYAWPNRTLHINNDSPGTGDTFHIWRPLSTSITAHFATEHQRIFVVITNSALSTGANWANLQYIKQHYKELGEYDSPTVDVMEFQTS